MRFNRRYALVNVDITMERSTIFCMGKLTILTGPFSIANCHCTRIAKKRFGRFLTSRMLLNIHRSLKATTLHHRCEVPRIKFFCNFTIRRWALHFATQQELRGDVSQFGSTVSNEDPKSKNTQVYHVNAAAKVIKKQCQRISFHWDTNIKTYRLCD